MAYYLRTFFANKRNLINLVLLKTLEKLAENYNLSK